MPFNLQVRNTKNTATNWQAVVRDRNFSIIPNLVPGNYTLTVVQNQSSLYDYYFEGTQPLGAFQNITITGGVPNPTGTCPNNVDLYIN